jgi:hypothetical protein
MAGPTGSYENFLTGFWTSGEHRAEVWGRPAALAVMKDGSLLIADDTGGSIWRVSYTGPRDRASNRETTTGTKPNPTNFDPHVPASGPTQRLERLHECCDGYLTFRVGGCESSHQYADPPHGIRLCACAASWPRGRAAEQGNEVARGGRW